MGGSERLFNYDEWRLAQGFIIGIRVGQVILSVVEYKRRRSVLYRADRVESFGPVIIINIGSVVN